MLLIMLHFQDLLVNNKKTEKFEHAFSHNTDKNSGQNDIGTMNVNVCKDNISRQKVIIHEKIKL